MLQIFKADLAAEIILVAEFCSRDLLQKLAEDDEIFGP
jgi:hypothetical protein